ncbi:hypothetical protein JL720_12786 [Aureococcus anophagefferens]|nr:hypothetical protein JL720_12786 [Aureococcus anophagefferens]
MCGLHALNVDNARQVAVLCFPTRNARDVVELMAPRGAAARRPRVLTIRSCPGSKPIALAEWEDVGSDVDAHTMASSLMSYFSTMFKPAAVDVAAPAAAETGGGDPPPAPAPTGEDKNALGARLYPLIELSQPELAGKLTGMFLEMSEADLVRLLESPAPRREGRGGRRDPRGPRHHAGQRRVAARVRDAVSHLCYLAGPRSDDGRGDRWLVRKLPKRGNGQDAGRTKRGAGAFLGGIADLDGDRVLKFFADELCAVEGVTAVDAHTAVAQFKLEAGCKCLRHQPLHLLFTADGRLFAFEVLDPGVVKNQHRNDFTHPNPYGYQHAPRYHRHEPPPPPVDPPSPAYSDEPPSPGVANGHDYTVEAAEPHGRAADDGPRRPSSEGPGDVAARRRRPRRPGAAGAPPGAKATMAACPPPGSDELSGFVPSGSAFGVVRGEMCGLHALHIDRSRKTAVLCFPTRLAREVVERMTRHDVPLPDGSSVALTVRSCPGRKPTAVAEWAGDSELDAGTMAKALMHYFSRCLRPTSVTVDLGEEPAYETRTVPGKDLNDDFANSASDGDEPGCGGDGLSAEDRETLGARLFPLDELLKLLESPVALDDKVAEAVANLDNGEASSAGSTAPTPDAPQTNGSTEKRRKPGGKVVGEIEFASLEARDAVVLLGYLNGPKGPDGRGDRWMLRRPRARPCRRRPTSSSSASRRARGVSAQLRSGSGHRRRGHEAHPALPGQELCALEALKAVDDRTAKAFELEAGGACVGARRSTSSSAESRLLAFEVLGGSRLRGALRADGASAPRPRDVSLGGRRRPRLDEAGRRSAQRDVKSIVAALKEALAEEASGDADRAALLESAIPKVVAAHVAAANGNGTSDPSTYVDQTPAT